MLALNSELQRLKKKLPPELAKFIVPENFKIWTSEDSERLLAYLGDKSLLPAYDDRIFKTLLAIDGVLAAIITGIVNTEVTNVAIVSPENTIKSIVEKDARFDTVAHFDIPTGKGQIDAEMQAHIMSGDSWKIDHVIIKDRSAFYASELVARQEAQGINFHKLRRSYSVFFLKQNIFDDGHSVRQGMYRDEYGNGLSTLANIIYVEMDKLKNATVEDLPKLSPLEQFGLFFGYVNDPEHKAVIDELIKSKKEVADMTQHLATISRNETERIAVFLREKAEYDLANFHVGVYDSGKNEGIEERDAYWAPQLAAKDAKLAEYERRFGKLD